MKAIYNKCFIGRDCIDITDKSLCLNATQCEYNNGKCSAKCSNHISVENCKQDNSCRLDTKKSFCTNSSILPGFKLISIIIIILFLIEINKLFIYLSKIFNLTNKSLLMTPIFGKVESILVVSSNSGAIFDKGEIYIF